MEQIIQFAGVGIESVGGSAGLHGERLADDAVGFALDPVEEAKHPITDRIRCGQSMGYVQVEALESARFRNAPNAAILQHIEHPALQEQRALGLVQLRDPLTDVVCARKLKAIL